MRWIIFNMLLLNLYLIKWASGQTIYDANKFYKPMTDDYDVRHRGNLFLPPCVKQLMNCWELIRPDLVCKYRNWYKITLESICMDLRFYCKEHTGPLPIKELNVVPWNYCQNNINEHNSLQLNPDKMGINRYNNYS